MKMGLLVMSTHRVNKFRSCVVLLCGFFMTNVSIADTEKNLSYTPRGQQITQTELAAWNTSIYPDGRGLPAGKGSVQEGEALYALHCVACHGERGIGGSAEELAGGMQGLTGEYPDKTVGTYWPYATTLFDFIQRAMPLYAPGSLSADETYALVAYVLYVNDLIKVDQVLSNETLPAVEMPNQDGFIRMENAR